MSEHALNLQHRNPRIFLLLAAIGWWLLYQALLPAAQALVRLLPADPARHLGGALEFFSTTRPRCCCCSPASCS